MTSKFDKAHWLAFLLPAALLGGAYGSQYIGGLYPCEMCWWQRYPHFAAVAIALVAFGVGNPAFRKMLVALAALAIATAASSAGFMPVSNMAIGKGSPPAPRRFRVPAMICSNPS